MRKIILIIFYILFVVEINAQNSFVLFDVQFKYTKHQADNATPSKSHFYVVDNLINPNRPKNWVTPIDYRNGTAHIRIEVIKKPSGNQPTTWTICYIPNKGIGNGYGCTGTDLFTKEGVYDKEISMDSFWENSSIIWEEGIKQIDLVMKDDSGGQGFAHKRKDYKNFFPTKIRLTVVQVPKGEKFDPNIIPKKTINKVR